MEILVGVSCAAVAILVVAIVFGRKILIRLSAWSLTIEIGERSPRADRAKSGSQLGVPLPVIGSSQRIASSVPDTGGRKSELPNMRVDLPSRTF